MVAAEDLPANERFDVITCLWNVLGSVVDSDRRLRALKKMGSLLTEHGRLFVDVNNRYNARAWDDIRDFLAVHYKFNTRIDTPFWRACVASWERCAFAPTRAYG